MRKMMPPIVGVLDFSWWLSGVPARITWRTFIERSRRTMVGPTTKAIKSPVIAAPAERKVM